MSTVGFKLLSSAIGSGSVSEFVGLGLGDHLFRGSEIELFNFVKNHVMSYGVLPGIETVLEKVGNHSLVDAPEPAEYYLVEAEKRYLQTAIKKMMTDAQELLVKQDPDKAFDTILNVMFDLHLQKHRNHIMDFRDAADVIKAEYLKQKQMDEQYTMKFGWPTLDNMVGGLRGGDLCSIIGRPASGKTFLGLSVACNTWELGGTPLFLSMEMSNTLITQRLASMKSHKSLTQLLKGMLSTPAYKELLVSLHALKKKERPFWVVDGNLAASVDDLMAMARQLKPSSIFVDGAYLLSVEDRRMSRFDRITENAERLKKRAASELDLPVIASYQFSREAEKKKKSTSKHKEGVGLEDIYGSDAIGQLSSVVLGLSEEENIETLVRRRVDVLKGRNGETGAFLINWDFLKMDFSEIPSKKDAEGKLKEDISDLQFL